MIWLAILITWCVSYMLYCAWKRDIKTAVAMLLITTFNVAYLWHRILLPQ